MKNMLLLALSLLLIGGCKLKDNNNPVAPEPDPINDVIVPGVIQNADFEQTDNNFLPKYWTTNITGSPQFNFFELDPAEKESGEKGLKITFIDSLSYPDIQNGSWGGIYQNLTINEFTPGTKYFLRFWVKSEIGKIHVRILKNGSTDTPLLSCIAPTDNQWKEYRIGFTTDPQTSFMLLYIVTKPALADNGTVHAWIDNLRITKTQ